MTAVEPALVERVRRRLSADGLDVTPHSVAEALHAEQRLVGTATVLAIVDHLSGESADSGVLSPLLAMPEVTDVLVNGADGVFIDRGRGLEPARVALADETEVRRLAQRLAARVGRRLDDASPWVDGRLADGTRLHAVLAPIARPGTVISLRVPPRRTFDLEDLAAAGTLTPEIAEVLRRMVAGRVSFVVSGGTGSGKTTVLAAMLSAVDPAERLVVVEDATELRPRHPHVVGLEARPANVEGAGVVTVRDLVRQAMRMRPDRLIVGEVRGAEVVDLLAALNTGHEGGCGTIHANAATSVPARLEALGVAAGLSREAVHSQIASGLAAVIHLGRGAGRRREVQEIGVVTSVAGGLVTVEPAWFVADGTARRGSAATRLEAMLP